MGKKTLKKSRLGPYLVAVAVFVGLISYLIIKPFLNWKTYTIDDFISISYPSEWHFQNDNYTMLSGEEYLFLISDYNGELSRQDFSSPDQKFLIEVNRVLRRDMKSFGEYVKPFLGFCGDTACLLRESKYKKAGFNIDEIAINGNKKTFYKGEYFYFVEGEEYIYKIHVGYENDVWLISNPLRKLLIEKFINSIDFK